MSKVGDELIRSLEEALAYVRDEPNDCTVHRVEVVPVDVRAARRKLGLSQARFASAFGVSVASLRKWEQGKRSPTGAARTLLRVIDHEPEAVMRALHGRPSGAAGGRATKPGASRAGAQPHGAPARYPGVARRRA